MTARRRSLVVLVAEGAVMTALYTPLAVAWEALQGLERLARTVTRSLPAGGSR